MPVRAADMLSAICAEESPYVLSTVTVTAWTCDSTEAAGFVHLMPSAFLCFYQESILLCRPRAASHSEDSTFQCYYAMLRGVL